MPHTPSSLRRSLLAALALAATGAPAWSQSGSPIRILVGFPPGGGTDAIARALADKLKDVLGVPVIVENKAGAGGQIAAQALKAAAPDGTTFFLSHDHSISILPLVTRNAGFDPATDFIPVAGFASFANVLAVSGGVPAKTLQEYVAWVQSARGGKDTIGVPAPGSIPEFLVGLVGAPSRWCPMRPPSRSWALPTWTICPITASLPRPARLPQPWSVSARPCSG